MHEPQQEVAAEIRMTTAPDEAPSALLAALLG
jgi:hypothetical protein